MRRFPQEYEIERDLERRKQAILARAQPWEFPMGLDKSAFEYLRPTDAQMDDMGAVRKAFADCASSIESLLPDGPDNSCAAGPAHCGNVGQRRHHPPAGRHPQGRSVVIEYPSIRCPRCGRISFNPNDVRFRYCGHCHAFHASMRDMVKIKSLQHTHPSKEE